MTEFRKGIGYYIDIDYNNDQRRDLEAMWTGNTFMLVIPVKIGNIVIQSFRPIEDHVNIRNVRKSIIK